MPAELRRDLVTRVLILLETFDAEHGLGLDFAARLDLLDLALGDLFATFEDAPTH